LRQVAGQKKKVPSDGFTSVCFIKKVDVSQAAARPCSRSLPVGAHTRFSF